MAKVKSKKDNKDGITTFKGFLDERPKVGDHVHLEEKHGKGHKSVTRGTIYEVSDNQKRFRLEDQFGNKSEKWHSNVLFDKAKITRTPDRGRMNHRYNIGDQGMFHGGEYRIKSFDEVGNYNIVELNGEGEEIKGTEKRVSIRSLDEVFALFPDDEPSKYALGGRVSEQMEHMNKAGITEKDEQKMMDETSLIPEIIADGIAYDAVSKSDKFKALSDHEKSSLIKDCSEYLSKSAYFFYKTNDHLHKQLKKKDGRDYLYGFMQHWADAWVHDWKVEAKYAEGGTIEDLKTGDKVAIVEKEVQENENWDKAEHLKKMQQWLLQHLDRIGIIIHIEDGTATVDFMGKKIENIPLSVLRKFTYVPDTSIPETVENPKTALQYAEDIMQANKEFKELNEKIEKQKKEIEANKKKLRVKNKATHIEALNKTFHLQQELERLENEERPSILGSIRNYDGYQVTRRANGEVISVHTLRMNATDPGWLEQFIKEEKENKNNSEPRRLRGDEVKIGDRVLFKPLGEQEREGVVDFIDNSGVKVIARVEFDNGQTNYIAIDEFPVYKLEKEKFASGGSVIGKTKSGKDIYDSFSNKGHADFTKEDHYDAHYLHKKLWQANQYKNAMEAIQNEHWSKMHKHYKAAIANSRNKKAKFAEGGNVIGQTRNGKDIYYDRSASDYNDFGKEDHLDAVYTHTTKSMDELFDNKDREKSKHHSGKADEHMEALEGIKNKNVKYAEGGNVIGETETGKNVYDQFSHEGHNDFTKEDHMEAANFHGALADKEITWPNGIKRIGKNFTKHSIELNKHLNKFLELRNAEVSHYKKGDHLKDTEGNEFEITDVYSESYYLKGERGTKEVSKDDIRFYTHI